MYVLYLPSADISASSSTPYKAATSIALEKLLLGTEELLLEKLPLGTTVVVVLALLLLLRDKLRALEVLVLAQTAVKLACMLGLAFVLVATLPLLLLPALLLPTLLLAKLASANCGWTSESVWLAKYVLMSGTPDLVDTADR